MVKKYIYDKNILFCLCVGVSMLVGLSGCFNKKDIESRMQRAEVYIAEQDHAAAMIEFKNVLKDDKNHLDARVGLARIFFINKNYRSARVEYEKVYGLTENKSVEVGYIRSLIELREADKSLALLEKSVTDENGAAAADSQLNLLFALGNILKAKYEIAKEYLDKIHNPASNADVQFAYAKAEIGLNNNKQAIELLKKSETLAPDELSIKLVMAQLLIREDSKDIALEKLEEVINFDAGNIKNKYIQIEARLVKSQVLLSQERVSKAEEELKILHEIDPSNPATNYLLALVAYQRHDYSLSGSYLSKSLARNQNHASSLYLMSLVKFSQKHFVQSEQYINRYLKQREGDLVAKKLLAKIKLASNRPTEVFNIFEDDVSPFGGDAELSNIMAHAALKSGDSDLAEKYLGNSLSNNTEDNKALLGIVHVYLANDEFDKAIDLLEKDPKIVKQNFEIFNLLVRSYMALGNKQKVLELIESDSYFLKENAVHYIFAGDVYKALGEVGKAGAAYGFASNLDANNTATLFKLAEINVVKGNVDQAIGYYNQINELEPENIIAWTLKAKLLYSKGSAEEADALVAERLKNHEKSYSENLGAAEYYSYTGNWVLAEEHATVAAEHGTGQDYAQYMLSKVQLNLGKVKESRAIVKTLLNKEPKNLTYHMLLGQGYIQEDNRQFAKQIFNDVLHKEPRYLPATLSLIKIEIANSNYLQAKELIKSQQENFPENIELSLAMAEVMFRSEEFDQAERLYGEITDRYSYPIAALKQYEAALKAGSKEPILVVEKWLKRFPDNTELKSALGSELIRVGRFKEAAVHLEGLVSEYRKGNAGVEAEASALNNLAWVYSEINDPRSVDAARAAYSLWPDSASIADTLGWVMVLDGDIREGKKLISQAMSAMPDNPDVAYHMAYAFLEEGEISKAKKLLEDKVLNSNNYHDKTKANNLYNKIKLAEK